MAKICPNCGSELTYLAKKKLYTCDCCGSDYFESELPADEAEQEEVKASEPQQVKEEVKPTPAPVAPVEENNNVVPNKDEALKAPVQEEAQVAPTPEPAPIEEAKEESVEPVNEEKKEEPVISPNEPEVAQNPVNSAEEEADKDKEVVKSPAAPLEMEKEEAKPAPVEEEKVEETPVVPTPAPTPAPAPIPTPAPEVNKPKVQYDDSNLGHLKAFASDYLEDDPGNVSGFYKALKDAIIQDPISEEEEIQALLKHIFTIIPQSLYGKYGAAHKTFFASIKQNTSGKVQDELRKKVTADTLQKLDESYASFRDRAKDAKTDQTIEEAYKQAKKEINDVSSYDNEYQKKYTESLEKFNKRVTSLPLCEEGVSPLADEEFYSAIEAQFAELMVEYPEANYLPKDYSKIKAEVERFRSTLDEEKYRRTYKVDAEKNLKTSKAFMPTVKTLKQRKKAKKARKVFFIVSLSTIAAALIAGTFPTVERSNYNVSGLKGLFLPIANPLFAPVVKLSNGYATDIDDNAFINNRLLFSADFNGVKSIGRYAFANTSLLKADLSDSVTHIGENAFYRCDFLHEVTFSENLKFIGAGAFSSCGNIDKIVIPHSVEKIEKNAFFNTKIKVVEYEGSPEQWAKINRDETLTKVSKSQMSIKLITKDGSNTREKIITESDNINFTIEIPEYNGYDFQGYYTEVNGQGICAIDKNGASRDEFVKKYSNEEKIITVYAYFTPKHYNLKLDANGGQVSQASYSVTFGKEYQLPIPTRKGYDFVGWYKGSTYIEASGSDWYYFTLSTEDTLTAKWAAKTTFVTFSSYGQSIVGSLPGSRTYAYGEAYQLPEYPVASDPTWVCKGWSFDGHILNQTGIWQYDISVMSLEAIWAKY